MADVGDRYRVGDFSQACFQRSGSDAADIGRTKVVKNRSSRAGQACSASWREETKERRMGAVVRLPSPKRLSSAAFPLLSMKPSRSRTDLSVPGKVTSLNA